MPSFAELIQQGAGNAWLFIPCAILLGALYGLEPGHSKTLMAAFIVAIKGTVAQAVMLGLAATLSHTVIVWIIALGGMYLWQGVAPEAFEPWFQLLSGLIIIAMALWMLWRARQDQRNAALAAGGHSHGDAHAHKHGHAHPHADGAGHHGHDETRQIDTGHGVVEISVFEDGVPPRWRVRTVSGQKWFARDITIATERPDGSKQVFKFRDRDGYLESYEEIPEPHQFTARVSLGHGGHSHDYDLSFEEGHGHAHAPEHEELKGLKLGADGYQDAHERAHANDIRKRFTDRNVTNWQIIVFGLTGGLIPCPAAITVLLLCLQLKEITLGAVLVLCFSLGLAVTLVTVGAAAALATRHAASRMPWLSAAARRAPYVSGILIIAVGLYVALHGLRGLSGA
jgi:nickel/cobalt transporter (NicO) family protein